MHFRGILISFGVSAFAWAFGAKSLKPRLIADLLNVDRFLSWRISLVTDFKLANVYQSE